MHPGVISGMRTPSPECDRRLSAALTLQVNWICKPELNAPVINFTIRCCFQTWAEAKTIPASYCRYKRKSQQRSELPGGLSGLATSLCAGGCWQPGGFRDFPCRESGTLHRVAELLPPARLHSELTRPSGKGVRPPRKSRLAPGRAAKHRKEGVCS